MEVDIGGTPEPDPMPQETVRDAESDEIVRKVERMGDQVVELVTVCLRYDVDAVLVFSLK